MDSLTHGAAGAFIAWAWPRRWAAPHAVAVSVTAALLPDADVFLPDPFNPDSALAHRGFTHSLVGVAVLAPLVAILPWWLGKQKGTYRTLVALVGLAMMSHLLLDLPTEVGMKFLWPFYAGPVFVEWLSGIDFTLFTFAVFVLLAAWTYASPGVALRRGILASALLVLLCWWLFSDWPLVGGRLGSSLQTEEPLPTAYPLLLGATLLVVLVAVGRARWSFRENRARFGVLGLGGFASYVSVCGFAHWATVSRIDEFTRARGIKVLYRTATRLEPSSFLAPVRWTGLVLAPEGVYQAQMDPFGTHTRFDFYRNAVQNEFLTRARAVPAVQRYVADTRFPVSCQQEEKGQHVVEFYDPWWGVGVVRVRLNARREVLDTRWVPVGEYVAQGTPPAAAPLDTTVPHIVPQTGTRACFLAVVRQASQGN